MSPVRQQPLTAEEVRARGRRNVAIALALGGFVALLFVLTLVRLKGQVLEAGVF